MIHRNPDDLLNWCYEAFQDLDKSFDAYEAEALRIKSYPTPTLGTTGDSVHKVGLIPDSCIS